MLRSLAAACCLLAVPCASVSVGVTIDGASVVNANISKLIFGMNEYQNQDDNAYFGNYTAVRKGGNAMTRLNYGLNAANSGNDWYYISQPLPHSWQDMDDVAVKGGISTLITQIPAMGWVAKSDTKTWSFSIEKYGPQQKNECTDQPGSQWCAKDAGNGVWLNGSKVTGNDPTDANVKTTPADGAAYAKAVLARYPTVNHIFGIDNEPTLWSASHRDVHPEGSTYDEIYGILETYGAVVKKTCLGKCDVMGPSSWGWCGYFTDGADHEAGFCQNGGPNREKHGNLTLLQFYLQQASAHEKRTGVRILDYLDVHFYPQAANAAFSCQEDEATSKNRLNAPRSLYDPSYVDPSWINAEIALIPRLKGWINQYYPGTKLSISEFNFGGDTCVTSLLAHVEALAIFATYDVSMATRWSKPTMGSLVVDAWKFFTDYDGSGSNVFDTYAVKTATSPIETLASYTLVKHDKSRAFVYFVNKDASDAATVTATVSGLPMTTTSRIQLFAAGKAHRLAPSGTATPKSPTSFDVTVPPYTAVLAVVTF